MAENSKIEWTDHTFNHIRGCTKVHEGCAHCYAEQLSGRNPGTLGIWGPNGTRVLASEDMWKQPVKWNKTAACCCRKELGDFEHEAGCPQKNRPRVFCASLADVFEDWQGEIRDSRGKVVHRCRAGHFVPLDSVFANGAECQSGCNRAAHPLALDDVRARLFGLIDDTPNLDWQLLTKRPENIRRMMTEYNYHACVTGDYPHEWQSDCDADTTKAYRENVWLGTSISTQEHADKQIPELLKCRDLSPVLFLSIEPLLGPVDLLLNGECSSWACGQCGSRNVDTEVCVALDDVSTYACGSCGYIGGGEDADWKPLIDWVIVGGESGSHARPMHPDWVRSIRDQCVAANVPFFFKQWGEFCYVDQMTEQAVHDLDAAVNLAGHGDYDKAWKIGKKAAGRLLDGKEWSQFPKE